MDKLFKYRAETSPIAWLYLLPALIFITVFSVVPLLRTFTMAFQSNRIFNPEFVGLDNLSYVIGDPKFHLAIGNTAMFAFVVVPVGMIISMLLALIIHDKVRGARFYETIFFIPYLTSIIAIGVVFRYLFNGDYGMINYLLGLLDIGPYNFLNNPKLNMLTLTIFGVWSSLAFNVIIMLSGLRSINPSFYSVAEMYGASKFDQFFKITLPALTPIITFLSITNFIGAFKVYSQVFALFNGKAGIGNRAMTAVFYIYNKFYVENRYGHGMAAAVLLFIFLLLFTIIQRAVLKRLAD